MGQVSKEPFGSVDGKAVDKFTLRNGQITVEILSYGGVIQSIRTPDRNNVLDDIVLGFDDLDGYVGKDNRYFGCLVGRVANRISKAAFSVDGASYSLAKNNGENCLHGGLKGLDKVVWKSDVAEGDALHLAYLSPDGENGFPGDLMVNVTYRLTPANELEILYKALCNRATPVNLTNHSYFNMAGHSSGSRGLCEHLVSFNADRMTPVSADTLIPTGEVSPVQGTNFDLRAKVRLGEMFAKMGADAGYDHNFCVNGERGLRLACRLEHPGTGRVVECFTDQPGIQFYTGNFLPSDDSLRGKSGATYGKHGAFCLETQNYPDAINQPGFPDSVLRPGHLYEQRTTYKFSVAK